MKKFAKKNPSQPNRGPFNATLGVVYLGKPPLMLEGPILETTVDNVVETQIEGGKINETEVDEDRDNVTEVESDRDIETLVESDRDIETLVESHMDSEIEEDDDRGSETKDERDLDYVSSDEDEGFIDDVHVNMKHFKLHAEVIMYMHLLMLMKKN
ncbi:hypothetical protein Tco_1070953 [Tanacetum coccineum]|uniref:Uncharacterized protein n=1 Tax=Tanacetum coccineum TaxID=301880 RepID=A0ABQ5HN16_9ASTR